MLFNTIQFALFFVIVCLLYLALPHKWQNRMLLVASCIFYGIWDWRFLLLLFTSISTDYVCSLKIQETEDERIKKRYLLVSIVINLSILGFFKYCNFFLDNLQILLNHSGIMVHDHFLKIVLPIGISFYTLKTMTYTLDVYRNEMKPTRSFWDYALYVAFFPQLIAGPIARAKDLLPQILAPRKFSLNRFYEGCYLIFWGVFQKIFIADNLARIVTPFFNSQPPYNGANVLLVLYSFAFQIYCDFAGYSNIAIGLGKCMGFETMANFNLPYFSTNPAEFWRKWHISLSTWLRDYLYTPIVVSKRYWGSWGIAFALMVTFLVCGLWHGAAWTFVIWGAYHGMILIIYTWIQPLLRKIPRPKDVLLDNLWFLVKILFFFHIICLGLLIFRAQSMTQAVSMIQSLVFDLKFNKAEASNIGLGIISFVWILIMVQLLQFKTKDSMAVLKLHPVVRAIFYCVCLFLLLVYGATEGNEFIYFQF
jgi:D-alanyl-lipoteichoic acid acyltransferase DltB (MBOAT superfamily)